jgi:hypothetical protein
MAVGYNDTSGESLMSMPVQARCPGCGNLARFPAEWIEKPVRCKKCRTVLHARRRPAGVGAVSASASVLPNGTPEPAPIIQLARSRNRLSWKVPVAAVVTLLLLSAVALWNWGIIDPHLRELRSTWAGESAESGSRAVPVSASKMPATKPAVATAPVYPRRLLAISVNNYLYANPVNAGFREELPGATPERSSSRQDRSINAVAGRLAGALNISELQVTVLSDSAPGADATPPMKSVIEDVVTRFLETCRKQDRIIVLFVGHAVEVGDDAHLVPIEGELTRKETLIPLTWLYERLAQCAAQEKTFIIDVCRFNPTRGMERPGAGPMGEKLDAALNNPPPGVRVWTACVAGQNSYEGTVGLTSDASVVGGFFLTELAEAVGAYQRRINLGGQSMNSSIPIERLALGDGQEIEVGKREKIVRGVNSCTTYDAKEWYAAKQTPRISGTTGTQTVAYDASEALPPRALIQTPHPAGDDAADRELVRNILQDIDAKMAREAATPLDAVALPPFSAMKMAEYRNDSEMTPLRQEVARAANLVKKHAKAFQEEFRGNPTANAIKQQILKRQHEPARAMAELMGQLETLKELEEESKTEKSKRWQANYHYVVAKLHAHLAYIYEYNYMLGQIRKDALPPRDSSKHTGWRLAASATLQSGSEGKKLAAEAKQRLEKLAKDHPGTPWEVMAKRQALTALGLEWQPCP